jgi:hypothetical protein
MDVSCASKVDPEGEEKPNAGKFCQFKEMEA